MIHSDEHLVVSFHWHGGNLQPNDTVLWSLTLASHRPYRTIQLGYKLVDGAFSAQFVFDASRTPMQENFDDDAELSDYELLLRFPLAAITADAASCSKRWVLNINGDDADGVVSSAGNPRE